MNKHHY